jgi:hypothetical protein
MYNLTFKEFLRQVVIPCTPEDQRDSVFFEFEEWADSDFTGIPSTEVQHLVDLNIPVWLNDFDNADIFAENLCEMHSKELVIRFAAIVARYAIEKCWGNTEDTSPIRAVELVEKLLENENSVTVKELNATADTAANAAADATADAAYSAANAAVKAADAAVYAAANPAAYATYATYAGNAAASAGYWSAKATSNKEVCQITVEKLPKFCYEDLLRCGYFTS